MPVMQSLKIRLRLLTAAVLVACQAATVLAADAVTADRRLPPGVLLYASCPDIPRTGEQFRQTSFGQLISDPELEDLRGLLIEKFEEFSKQAEEKIEMPLSDLAALFSGELSFALVRPLGQSLGYVMFMDVGDHRDILDRVLAKIDAEMANRDASKEVETVDGVAVTLYSVPRDTPDTPPYTTAYFVRDNMVVVGSTLSLLKSVLTRWDGQHAQTFAGSDVYKELMAKCLTDGQSKPAFKWFVNPIDLAMAGLATQPEYQMASIMFSAYLPTLGLNRLKAFGGAMELATEEFDSVSRTMVYVEPPATGLLKVFEFRASIQGPPAWVPEDAAQFFGLDWNVAGAYAAIESIYDSFMGQPGAFERQVNQAAGPAGGLHPKKDIIDALTGSVQGYIIPPASGDAKETQGVVVVGLTDDEKGKQLLEGILKQSGSEETSELRGTTLYHLGGEGNPGVATIKSKQLIIADSAERLMEVVAGQTASPLTRSTKFKPIADKLPPAASILTYQDASDQMKAAYEAARSGGLDAFVEGRFDFSILPPFDTLSKYFRPQATYVVPVENGAITVQFTLKRAE